MTNKRTTKRALIASVISTLLCFTMLLGTTYAWFTDSVASTNNIIQAGNLDIELEYWNGTEWKDVQGSSEILDADARWEPGYTEVAYLRLKNAGTLSLKYNLGVNIVSETEGVNVDGKTFKLSDYIFFDVVEGVNGQTSAYATREDAMKVATQNTKISRGYTKVGTLNAGSDYVYTAMIIHMPTSVGNEANYKTGTTAPKIELGVNVYASQNTYENDSFGNDYDGEAFVPVADVDVLGPTTVAVLGSTEPMNLEAAFSFKTTEDATAAAASGYRYWHADFVVSASGNIAANSMALAGYYEAYAQATNTVGQWIALSPDTDVAAGTQIRLLEYMGVTGNYEELCDWIPEFLCGVTDYNNANQGKTLTVELRLYETYSEEECLELFGYKSKNVETGNYKTIGIFTHTFGGEYETLDDGTVLFSTNDGEVLLYNTADVTDAEYTVPDGVTHLNNYAFSNNTNIKEVTLPETVTDLGRAFDSNTTIEKVVLNEGLETISSRAFKSTTALEEVVIPSTVTTIADNAFQKSGIKSITIPANVETIGETSFGASMIEEVIFEGNTAIQGYAFRGCSMLRKVILKGDDVTFVPSTLNGRNSTWFCNSESNNPNTSDIDFYVVNDTVAARVKTAMGAEANNTDVIVCDIVSTADELSNALAIGGNVLLTADIGAESGLVIAEGATLDGNGHTVTYSGTAYNYHLVKLSTNSALKNINFKNYRVRTEDSTNGNITMENVVIDMDNDLTGLDISRGVGTATLTNVQCKGIKDATHLDPATQVQVDYEPYGDVLLGTTWGLEATDCSFGSLHGWNTTNGSNVSLTNTTATVFRMHYWSNRILYINGVETAWSASGAIPVAHDVGGCWSVQPAFK